MRKRKDWIKKKDMTPEEREAYNHYECEFSNRYFKQHTILFFVWLVVLVIGYVLEFMGHWNLLASILHLLWTLAGLAATLVFDHYIKSYAQEHIHDPIPETDTVKKVDITVVIDDRTPEQASDASSAESSAETTEAPTETETPANDTEAQ